MCGAVRVVIVGGGIAAGREAASALDTRARLSPSVKLSHLAGTERICTAWA